MVNDRRHPTQSLLAAPRAKARLRSAPEETLESDPSPNEPKELLTSGAATRVLDTLLALVALVLAFPLFVIVALLILVTDGRPVLYRGERLGRHKRPFRIFKFRTLHRDAAAVLGPRIFTYEHGLLIPCGRFLRDTRLDELPQLFNILKGDMSFFGPRPERPGVYERFCRNLPGYDRRFSLRPGLLGPAQLFTPHDAPKRLRTALDRTFVHRRSSRRDLRLIAYAISAAATWVGTGTFHFAVRTFPRRCFLSEGERRRLQRQRPGNFTTCLIGAGGNGRNNGNARRVFHASVVDATETTIRVRSPEFLARSGSLVELRMLVEFRRRRFGRLPARRKAAARCTGTVLQTRRTPEGCDHVIRFEPVSTWSRYTISQYLLSRSFARPFAR